MSLLSVDKLDARHGLLQAVREVSFSLAEGEILALVGANGAGKTTLLRSISGAHRLTSGTISFDGTDVTHVRANKRVKMGIALVPEGRRLFGGMTVEENLEVAGRTGRPGMWNKKSVLDAFPVLRENLKRRSGDLSGGQQQATSIGRALMTNPRVLLLDEVSLGLSPVAVNMVYESLQTVIASGATIVLVEQDLARALRIAIARRVHARRPNRFRRQGVRLDTRTGHRSLLRAAPPGRRERRIVMWFDQILQGVFLGGYYALIACGLSFMFGVLRIINLAHGSIAVLAAYLVWSIADLIHISPFLALVDRAPDHGARSAGSCSVRFSSAACARARSRRCSARSGSRS